MVEEKKCCCEEMEKLNLVGIEPHPSSHRSAALSTILGGELPTNALERCVIPHHVIDIITDRWQWSEGNIHVQCQKTYPR